MEITDKLIRMDVESPNVIGAEPVFGLSEALKNIELLGVYWWYLFLDRSHKNFMRKLYAKDRYKWESLSMGRN